MNQPKYKVIAEFHELLNRNYGKQAEEKLQQLQQSNMGPADNKLIQALCNKYESVLQQNESPIPQKTTLSIDYSNISQLSELDAIKPLPGISIVTCCMNRNDNLKKALKTWLKLAVDEIVIVDWSSNTPVSETLADIKDSRIKIIRVENEPSWILTYGFNVGLRAASFSKIFKLDADIEVSANFLELNDFSDMEYVRGHWKSALDNSQADQAYVNGSFGCNKKHLLEIGFYNEYIRTYGWDVWYLFLML